VRLIAAPIAAVVAAVVLTPLVGRLAERWGAVDHPDERHAHARSTPTCGGIAIFAAFWIAVLLIDPPLGTSRAALLVASSALLLISVVDDVRGLSPVLRLVAQVALAAGLWWLGDVRIAGVSVPWGSDGAWYWHFGNWSFLPTVAWIVLIINALNWLDGLDGLAAGVAVIAATTLAVIAWGMGSLEVSIMGAALAGAALGFLGYNVKPARIFMGDAGAMFLGLVLGCAAVTGTLKTATVVTVIVPLLVLGVPIYDVFSTVARRARDRQPVHVADRQHVHHRLLSRGWSEGKVVMVLWAVAGALSMLALYLASRSGY
jgi:UDP-GlcNAc:undecaprenyl-phosphate GlcNAc-1-phosphate transferase